MQKWWLQRILVRVSFILHIWSNVLLTYQNITHLVTTYYLIFLSSLSQLPSAKPTHL